MIDSYYECNHGLVAVVDGKTYLLTEDIIKQSAIKPVWGRKNDYVQHFDND